MKRIIPFALLLVFYVVVAVIEAQNNRAASTNGQDMDIFYHTVETGQTVFSIAKLYDVMVIDIHRLNPGSEKSIKAGERLKIPQRKFEVKSILNEKKDNDFTIHTIQAKETLLGLSRSYNVSAESILQANPGLTLSTFTTGRKIRIPKSVVLQPSSQVVEKNGAKEVYYTVPSGETIYNIGRLFKTTERELLEMNPELSGGLRAGMVLRIPLRISENELPANVGAETKPVTVPPIIRTSPKLANAVKVALILPFNADNPLSAISRQMTEYYSGLLLVVDSLRNQGLNVELFVYDIGDKDSEAPTRRLLQEKNEELKKINLLIGGFDSLQVRLIADFAKQNQIKYVIPFSSNDEFIRDNRYIFQVPTPSNYLNVHAANAGANLFGKYNIIFLDTKDTLTHTEFIRGFKQELKERYITYKDAVYDATNFETYIQSMFSDTKPNLIIPISQSMNALIKIKPILRMIAETKPEYNLTLYGYPLWQTYLRECLEDFHILNTFIYSRFYVDNMHPNVKRFYNKYKYWYNRSPETNYPQIAMLGFDTGMYFLSAMLKFGINFEESLPEMNYKSLQTGFNFIRINDAGGFINSNIFIIHYNKDYSVTYSEFK